MTRRENARGKVRETVRLVRASSTWVTTTLHGDHGRPLHSVAIVMMVWPWCIGIVDGPFRTEPPRGPARRESHSRSHSTWCFSFFLSPSPSAISPFPLWSFTRPLRLLFYHRCLCCSVVHLLAPFGLRWFPMQIHAAFLHLSVSLFILYVVLYPSTPSLVCLSSCRLTGTWNLSLPRTPMLLCFDYSTFSYPPSLLPSNTPSQDRSLSLVNQSHSLSLSLSPSISFQLHLSRSFPRSF